MIRVPEDGELDLLPTLLLRGLGATGGGGLRLDLAEREGDLDWTGVTGDPRLLERLSDPLFELAYTMDDSGGAEWPRGDF